MVENQYTLPKYVPPPVKSVYATASAPSQSEPEYMYPTSSSAEPAQVNNGVTNPGYDSTQSVTQRALPQPPPVQEDVYDYIADSDMVSSPGVKTNDSVKPENMTSQHLKNVIPDKSEKNVHTNTDGFTPPQTSHAGYIDLSSVISN